MNYPTLLAVVLLHEFLFLTGIAISNSQRTNARQGVAKVSPTVTIPGQGTVMGKEIIVARPEKVTVYLGIPYAQPPTGTRRFAAPVTDPLDSWEGTRNATKFAPSCLQVLEQTKYHEKLFRKLLPQNMEDPGMDEDCLYLNIYVPDGSPPDGGWPVMVWFHGGDFNTGTPAIWDATIFVHKEKILVVTVAYRLNIFGFFTTADAEAPGNYGLLDQVAALDWIQKNIKLFGGSPDNVILFGHDAGAISVGLHILSPLSKGKFAKAIAMSGNPITTVKKSDEEISTMNLISSIFGHCVAKPTSKLIECLRSIPADSLLNLTAEIDSWGLIIDADTNNSSMPFITRLPRDTLEYDDFNSVPMIIGYTSNEESLAFIENTREDDGKITAEKFETRILDEITNSSGFPQADNSSKCQPKTDMITDTVLFFYRPYPATENSTILRDKYLTFLTEKNYISSIALLASKVSKKAQAFVYRFDYRARTLFFVKNIPDWAGVPHMFELPFVWGLPHMLGSNILWSGSDKNLADAMMMMIGHFIRTGDPSLLNVKWDPFTEESPNILRINITISNSDINAIDHRMVAFWNDYYPALIADSMNTCCNSTNNGVSTYLQQFNWELCVTSNVIIMAIIHLFYH